MKFKKLLLSVATGIVLGMSITTVARADVPNEGNTIQQKEQAIIVDKYVNIKDINLRNFLGADGFHVYYNGATGELNIRDLTFDYTINIYAKSSYVGYNYTTQGSPVMVAQILLLVSKPRYFNDICDGIFGPKTHSAVINFQRDNGLSVDATVGPLTWQKMVSKV